MTSENDIYPKTSMFIRIWSWFERFYLPLYIYSILNLHVLFVLSWMLHVLSLFFPRLESRVRILSYKSVNDHVNHEVTSNGSARHEKCSNGVSNGHSHLGPLLPLNSTESKNKQMKNNLLVNHTSNNLLVNHTSNNLSIKHNIAQYLRQHLPPSFSVPIYGKSGAYNIISQCVRPIPPENPYRRQFLTTSDGGTIAIDWLDNQWQERLPATAPVMLFVHGFGGSSQSDDFRSLSPLVQDKFRVVCMVCRGHHGLKLTNHISFSSQMPSDLGYVIEAVKKQFPETSGFHLTGCSMGGIISIKYLLIPNEKQSYRQYVKSLLTACSPLAAKCLSEAVEFSPIHEAVGRLMTKKVIDYLNSHRTVIQSHPKMRNEEVWRQITQSTSVRAVQEAFEVTIDDSIETIEEFFEKNDTLRLPIEQLSRLTPWVHLVAEDDPVIGYEASRLQELISRCQSPNVAVVSTELGGHLAFADMRDEWSHFVPDYWINTFFRVYTQFLLETHDEKYVAKNEEQNGKQEEGRRT